MPIRGIIFFAVILIAVAFYYRDIIYNWITTSTKYKNDEDDNTKED